MAFFGLTALGPQNSFEAQSRHHRNLQIFEYDDFKEAWERVNGKNSISCPVENLQDVFRALFRGPIPENDAAPLSDGFDHLVFGRDSIAFDEYMKTMIKLRQEAEEQEHQWEGKPKPECEYISSQTFQERLQKNAAIQRDLQTKLTVPLTAMQEYGWEKQQPVAPSHGRSGSDITKFAAELIKNGIYY
jgi:hypothetical protein